MAVRTICICDTCKVEVVSSQYELNRIGWKDIEVKLGDYNSKRFTLCAECLDKCGLVDKGNNNKTTAKPIETIQDRLFEVISEIVQEANGNG